MALGTLSGHPDQGQRAAQGLLGQRDQLAKRHQRLPKVRVFYQIWSAPLMTLNGQHPINEIIQLCGGRNLFAELPGLAPTISLEAVIAADPEIIIASGTNGRRPPWLNQWQEWPDMSAVRHQHLYHIHPDLLQRNGPRILEGAEQLCRLLEAVK
jgi:iron complex transport system substrate-binding protein